MKLNLACGVKADDDGTFVRVDIDTSVDPDELVDLQSFPWPWATGSVDEVICAHYLEHAPRHMWASFMEELHRILVPDGIAVITHPNLKSQRAFADPSHVDFIPPERWLYASRKWREENHLDRPPYPDVDFGIVEVAYGNFSAGLEHRSDEYKIAALAQQWEAANDVLVRLVRKD